MTKTAQDIVTLALRQIGVTAIDEDPEGAEYEFAHDIYQAEFDRLKVDQAFDWTWTYDEVPDALFQPMAMFAASNYQIFERPVPSQAKAIARLRSYSKPDDRDGLDLDEDGTVSDAERAHADRATYY